MRRHYASDEMVQRMGSAGARLSSAQYIYRYDEAIEASGLLAEEVSWIMDAIPTMLDLRGTVKFAVVGGSTSAYQVSFLGNNVFVVLIDSRAFYYLLILCLRIQSLPPLAGFLDTEEKEERRNYSGKYLLDITKSIIFHSGDTSVLAEGRVRRDIYQAALAFIVGHEIAHIAHGHLEFLASQQLSEFCRDDVDRDLTLRTLEMDADSSATSSVFNLFERIILKLSYSDGKDREKNTALMRRRYVLGTYIALIYLDTMSANFAPRKYPITYARFLTAWSVFKQLFSSYHPEAVDVPDGARSAVVEAFVRLSGSVESLGYPMASNIVSFEEGGDPIADYSALGIAAGFDHLTPLNGRWARLRPHLESFRRGGRLAPASAPPY